MKVGVAINAWKLPIFEKHLKDYKYEKQPGITSDTLTLIVYTDHQDQLVSLMRAANAEAADVKKNSN